MVCTTRVYNIRDYNVQAATFLWCVNLHVPHHTTEYEVAFEN